MLHIRVIYLVLNYLLCGKAPDQIWGPEIQNSKHTVIFPAIALRADLTYYIRNIQLLVNTDLNMATTKVSKQAKNLIKNPVPIEKSWEDRFNLVAQQLSPDQVRMRLQMASMGQVGAIQTIYQMMDTDGKYAGICKSLKSAVAMCPSKIVPARKKSRSATLAYKIVLEQFSRINKVKLISQLCNYYIRGVYVGKMIWKLEGSSNTSNELAFFKGLEMIPGSRLVVDTNFNSPTYGELMLMSDQNPSGRPISSYQPGALLLTTEEVEGFSYDMIGAARRCLGWWLSKMYTQVNWTDFNDNWAEPTRVAYVPNEMKAEKRKEIARYLRFLGRNLYAIFDEDVELDLESKASMGTVSTYRELIQLANDEMSFAITGSSLSSGSNKQGSYARDESHLKVRRENVISIAANVEEEINHDIIPIICNFNIDEQFDPEEMPSLKIIVPRAEEKEKLAEMYDKVTKFIPVSVRQIREDLDLEEPVDGEETIGPDNRNQFDQFRDPKNDSSAVPDEKETGKSGSKSGEADDNEPA